MFRVEESEGLSEYQLQVIDLAQAGVTAVVLGLAALVFLAAVRTVRQL